MYTEWLVFMGSGSEEIIQLAIQSMPDSGELLASCFYWLGKLCMRRNDVEEAHRAFVQAIELHVQAQDVSGEADDLYELGNLYIWWGKLEEAESLFKRALELQRAGTSPARRTTCLTSGSCSPPIPQIPPSAFTSDSPRFPPAGVKLVGITSEGVKGG